MLTPVGHLLVGDPQDLQMCLSILRHGGGGWSVGWLGGSERCGWLLQGGVGTRVGWLMSVGSVDWALHELHRVFDGNQSGDTEAGIGLALVKQIADAHGAVEVTSPRPGLDHGTRSTISFRLPGRTAG